MMRRDLMKLINRKEESTFIEIELENSFLIWKWTMRYRAFGKEVFEYKYPNSYEVLEGFEYLRIRPYFDILVKS